RLVHRRGDDPGRTAEGLGLTRGRDAVARARMARVRRDGFRVLRVLGVCPGRVCRNGPRRGRRPVRAWRWAPSMARSSHRARSDRRAVPFLALLLTPQVPPPAEPTNSFRVMTYNIHQGFNAGQVPSLDMLVDVISRESPDVLVLQEVVRGWMVDEQHDSLSVLAERLAMPYVFAPNIGDLYGNAILSRFPMTDVRRIHFAVQASARHQPRGAVGVRVGDVLIVTTHLDDVADSSGIRQEQVRTILREWDGEKVAIVAGDMNAEPDALE